MAEPAVVLFWGEDPYLLREEALGLLAARGMRATEIEGRAWQGGEMADLATPSLLGEPRVLLVTGSQALPDSGTREIRAYLQAVAPDALLVMTLGSAARQPPPLAKAVQAAGGLVRQVVLRRQDLPKWVVDRARSRGVRLSGPGAAALIGTVGEDAAVLDQAVEQLGAAFGGRPIGPSEVHSQFRGLGEQRVWDLCDLAFTGRLPQALRALRALLETREDPLLILGGVASRLRDLIRVRALPDRLSSSDGAKAAGLRFDWQLRRYREQASRYGLVDLAWLHRQVGEADRALKGGVGGELVLCSLVAAISGRREAALDVPIRVSR
jgi:DNA polymerase-3 subunit delta